MKILQVGNQQTNFKSGIVTEKGCLNLISRNFPEFARMVETRSGLVQVRQDLNGADFFWFSESLKPLAEKISAFLNLPPSLERGFFADSLLQPNTMDTLIDLSGHLRGK